MIDLPKPVLVEGAVLGFQIPDYTGHDVRLVTDCTAIQHMRASSADGLKDHAVLERLYGTHWQTVPGDTLYAGAFFPHFGHAVAESMHRLWAEKHFGPYDRIVFQAEPGARRRPWFDDILRACAVDPGKVRFVDGEERFERLHIPRQGRVLRGLTLIPGYEQLFPLAPIPIDPDGAKFVYVSRHEPTYIGEDEIEAELSSAGFRIIRPHILPLSDMLTALRSASVIVFAEGSAIHNLELIGRIDAKVLVVARRHGCRHRFIELLKTTANDRDFFGAIEPTDELVKIDIPKLIDWIAGHTGLSIRYPERGSAGFACLRGRS